MKKLVNFRDLGGLAAADGKRVRAGRLLRSAEPVGLLTEEIKMLQGHGLAMIVDFRSPLEIEGAPVDVIDGVAYLNLDVMADKITDWTDPNKWMARLSPENADADMMDNYKQFIYLQSSKLGFSEFLRECANAKDGAILFHCAAGKDRTGFGAAIVLKLLGVSDEDIYADYLKTLEERKEANAEIIEKYRAMGLSENQLHALDIMYGVKREYLAAAFAAMEEEYGSFENYLQKGLGVTPQDVAKMRESYLA